MNNSLSRFLVQKILGIEKNSSRSRYEMGKYFFNIKMGIRRFFINLFLLLLVFYQQVLD